jgi:CheY-like chemotaxis protein
VQFIPKTTGADADYEQPALQGRGPPVFLMFQVADSGQGLSDEETQKLFHRFVQANAKTHVKYGGSGLGLFISKRLVELQNGAIGVSSREGIGSLFAFYIEAFVPTEAAIQEARASPLAATTSAVSTASASLAPSPAPRSAAGGGGGGTPKLATRMNHIEMPKKGPTAVQVVSEVAVPRTPDAVPQMMPLANNNPGALMGQAALVEAAAELGLHKILIVEDNVINQKALFRGLTKLGLTVEIANHGLEALERLSATSRDLQLAIAGASAAAAAATTGTSMNGSSQEAHVAGSVAGTPRPAPVPIDMILMDVEMPVQDGLTCTRRIRELEADGDMTVSASSSLSTLGMLQEQPPTPQQLRTY